MICLIGAKIQRIGEMRKHIPTVIQKKRDCHIYDNPVFCYTVLIREPQQEPYRL